MFSSNENEGNRVTSWTNIFARKTVPRTEEEKALRYAQSLKLEAEREELELEREKIMQQIVSQLNFWINLSIKLRNKLIN